MRTSATSVLGVAVSFLVVSTLGRNTNTFLRPHRAPKLHSGMRSLLHRLSDSFRRTTPKSAMDLDDFLLNERSLEGRKGMDLKIGHGGLEWLLSWVDFSCLSQRSQVLLQALMDVVFNECSHFTRIQALIKSFLDAMLVDCGRTSPVKRFIKWLISMILSECEGSGSKESSESSETSYSSESSEEIGTGLPESITIEHLKS
ncbi:uncharacterized protein [Periplaneta americana]|uniref:uncharacterized protein isoform X2 n=1 Tax=Periplaneta americana TaxID=6978 RepID=UPI0037E6F7F6